MLSYIKRGTAMFTERLNKIMKTVGAKTTDIAGIIGCDRSAVDRI